MKVNQNPEERRERKQRLKQLMVLGVCAISLAASTHAVEPQEVYAASYSYEFTTPQYTERNVAVGIRTTDSKPHFIELDQSPVIINGRTFVPMRAVFEELGCQVGWDQSSRTATISRDSTSVQLTIGNTQMLVTEGGQTSSVSLDAAPVVINGRTLLPLRAPAEAFGYFVEWDPRPAANFNGPDYEGVVRIMDATMKADYDATLEQQNKEIAEIDAKEAEEKAKADSVNTGVNNAITILEQMDAEYKSRGQLDAYTYANEVVKCMNIMRAEVAKSSGQNLVPLTMDSVHQSAAMVRAQEISVQWSHTRPDGSDFLTAVPGLDAEHNWNVGGYRPNAEILERKVNSTATPAATVIGWMKSPAGHGLAVRDVNAVRVGVGVYNDGKETFCAAMLVEPAK